MGVWDFPINDIDKNKNGESCLYDLYALSNHYMVATTLLTPRNRRKLRCLCVLFYRRVGSKTEIQSRMADMGLIELSPHIKGCIGSKMHSLTTLFFLNSSWCFG
ncbi:hypothetical protein YC2023_002058 [Brassica napus]